MEYNINKTPQANIYTMTGRFVFSDHEPFSDLMEEVRLSSKNRHVLDMAGLDFIDSAGLGMLVVLRDVGDQHNKKIVIENAKDKVAQILRATNLDALFADK